jgi:hypothetical protein
MGKQNYYLKHNSKEFSSMLIVSLLTILQFRILSYNLKYLFLDRNPYKLKHFCIYLFPKSL